MNKKIMICLPLAISVLLIPGCSKKKGCTDPKSNNYDKEAEKDKTTDADRVKEEDKKKDDNKPKEEDKTKDTITPVFDVDPGKFRLKNIFTIPTTSFNSKDEKIYTDEGLPDNSESPQCSAAKRGLVTDSRSYCLT